MMLERNGIGMEFLLMLGVDMFCRLANDSDPWCSESAISCLVNIASDSLLVFFFNVKDSAVNCFKKVGFRGVFNMLDSAQDRVVIVKFFVNMLNNCVSFLFTDM